MLEVMKIAILGYGLEGKSALKFLKKKYQKADFIIRDIKRQGKDYLKNLENFDTIVRSPGIPYLSPQIQKAKKHEVKITSATKLFLENTDAKIIGVTGSYGKSTTATLIYKLLKAGGLNAFLVGNIGKPAIEILPKLKKNSVIVLELSSFQLQGLDFSPNTAVVLDISPAHLDHHKSFKEYLMAKSNIARFQKERDKIFYFGNSHNSSWVSNTGNGKKIPVSVDNFNFFSPNDLIMVGEHNFKNAVIAFFAASDLGINNKILLKTIKSFKGLEHRLNLVSNTSEVSFYNDSASVTPEATLAALKAFNQKKILIAGGLGRNLNYKILSKAIDKDDVKSTILLGENKNQIASFAKEKAKLKLVSTLEQAVKAASSVARPGDVVLFSPGSASFDMFGSYKERGRIFVDLVKKLKARKNSSGTP